MGSSQQPVTQQTTQTRDPWSGAQPNLLDVMAQSKGLVAGTSTNPFTGQLSTGYEPYSGQTQVPLDPALSLALGAGTGLAQAYLGGNPFVSASESLGGNVISSQGLTPGIQAAAGGLGQAAGQYGDIYSQASGQQNPYLQGVINQQMDKVNAAMSGAGRYGSGAHSAAVAQAISPILAQDYLARQQQRLAATQGFGGVQQSLADLYGQGLQRAGQWSQLMPTLQAAQFAGADKLAGYGEYMTQRAQQQLADQIKLYNAQQAYPWEQLARYSAISQGAGGLGGSQVTTAPGPQQPSLLQSGLGGALAGASLGSIFGVPGAGVGALGGGLLGLLR